MFFLACVCYAFVCACLYVPCGHLLGKGWPLGSRLWCLAVSLLLSHWYHGSGVVLDCIDSWSLHPYFLWCIQDTVEIQQNDQMKFWYVQQTKGRQGQQNITNWLFSWGKLYTKNGSEIMFEWCLTYVWLYISIQSQNRHRVWGTTRWRATKKESSCQPRLGWPPSMQSVAMH